MSGQREAEVERVIEKYSGSLFRMCFVILKHEQDAQDVLQEAFIKYMQKSPEFRDEAHEKAWLFKITANLCKDLLRFKKRNQYVDMKELEQYCKEPEESDVLKEVMTLPAKYKMAIHLYYIEGYHTSEIAKIMQISESAVKKRMQRGREMLKTRLEAWE